MKNSILKLMAVSVILILFFACSDNKTNQDVSPNEIVIRINVKDEIIVNSDTVALENLETKLKELGVTTGNYIRLKPDPEAGAGTIERVQRKIRVYQSSE